MALGAHMRPYSYMYCAPSRDGVLQGAPSKVRVPEPKGFRGLRNAKESENFLWDME